MRAVHKRWLMCAPDHYDVRYEINPWMDLGVVPDKVRAQQQWQALHTALTGLGLDVRLVPQGANWPDMVFTANAGLMRGTEVVMSRFRFPERAGETPLFDAWFQSHGYSTHHLTSGAFEGEGDALFVGDLLVGGYGFRSDREVYPEIARILSVAEVIPVQLINPSFYHLDTCFCPIGGDECLIVPTAFAPQDLAVLGKRLRLIEVDDDEGKRFACNSVVAGDTIVMPSGCPKIRKVLESRGYTVQFVELDEFLKAGGAAKCLSLMV